MVDPPQILGLQTGSSISEQKNNCLGVKDFCKLDLSAIKKWCSFKKSPSTSSHSPGRKAELEAKSQAATQKTAECLGEEKEEEETMNAVHSFRYNADSVRSENPASPGDCYKHKSMDSCFPNVCSSLSRNGSRRSPSPTPSFLRRSKSKGSTEPNHRNSLPISRDASKRSSAHIMFSNSTGMVKPPAVHKNLECTLEELCYGCMKKIKVTRDVLTNTGQIVQEEEILIIDVKPGWKKGTMITFEGMGNERPGTCPADIIFVIAEKRHHLFQREGDNLEIVIEISLLKALTGCEISIPLLGGENMSLMIDDIIYPGYEKIIRGQGMSIAKEHGKRGNLKIVFLVEFPTELTDEQRSDILSILEDSC
uniref:Chaperone DnaJ C-terminal domain-containing protein n=1 Tax=Manihot esculenta TaxID=3983 RepID=A0A2C9U162_MANES